jgi:hypothetical protein
MSQVELIESESPTPKKAAKREPRVRTLDRYGRIAVGQLVEYDRVEFAPTNSAPPWYLCGRRNTTTREIEHRDETVGVQTLATVVRLERYEMGGIGCVLRFEGGNEKTISINSYGQSPGNFAYLRVIAEPPEQKKLQGIKS